MVVQAGQCDADPLPPFVICFLGLSQTVTGTFTQWAEGPRFVDTAGTEWDLMTYSPPGGLDGLPDLSLAGEVAVTQSGGCDAKGGVYAVVHVADASGATLFVVGTNTVEDFFGWTVAAELHEETCPGREAECYESIHDRPVTFTHGGDPVLLVPSGTATMDGHTVRVDYAWSASGSSTCDDVAGAGLSWRIVGPAGG